MGEITFIVYTDEDEVFVTTPDTEEDFIHEYGEYRDLQGDFTRDEYTQSQIRIQSNYIIDGG